MKTDVLDYYTTHSRFTDPGDYANHLDILPTDMDGLHTALGSLMIHIWKIQKYHPNLLSKRSDEIKIRHIRRS
ncbi:MAG: hypothetical protein OXG87_02115, partial [Gemmatimonadetes bacterium]|nr:hypothetical protein [Gemmatimonadota bacterium]